MQYTKAMIVIKRVYEPSNPSDGYRILVDRLWPRGVSKEKAKIDVWLKEIAPSDTLRKRFHHDPVRWEEFKKQYALELQEHEKDIEFIRNKAAAHTVTLLFAAKNVQYNNAVALKGYLQP